jgi:GAF domain-containing protein
VTGNRAPDSSVPLTEELAGVFARMSGLLLNEETLETSLSLLSSLARETVPGSAGAGVSLIDGRRRISSGSTDDRVREADRLQYELDEGPCLTAAQTRELIRMDDVATDRRWPHWSAVAEPLGLHAVLSVPLVAGGRGLGAVKVYADRPGAFDAHSEQLLTLFAAQAALLVGNVQTYQRAQRLSEDMRQAMRDRDVVGVAKGVLIGRHGIDEDTALRMLMSRSQEEATGLAEAARTVVDFAVRRRR